MFGQLERPSTSGLATATIDLAFAGFDLAGGLALGTGAAGSSYGQGCPVLDFARSGAMWITGGRRPVPIEFPLLAHLGALCSGIEVLSTRGGRPVRLDPALVIAERAAQRGFTRGGRRSANRCCRLVEGNDGWIACNLPRPSDLELLPAILERTPGADPWAAIGRAARRIPVATLAERAQQVGVAFAVLDTTRPCRPAVTLEQLGLPSLRAGELRVVDLSAMWAGPLCAHILGLSGARVCKVEDPARPDGARLGDPQLYRQLHDGHALAAISFSADAGRRALDRLVNEADVVIESSRPRALEALGITPQRFLGGAPGRTWISITGYGRNGAGADRVAFGDDAAVAGGLVAWDGSDAPMFCADALADPLSGLFAAVGGLASMSAGGGLLVDVSMRDASAAVRAGGGCPADHSVEAAPGGGWQVHHDRLVAPVVRPAQLLGADRG